MIRLDVAPTGHECETCPARNYGGYFETTITAIYALHIGQGYRQPSYLCPDCLARLRSVLGVSSGNATCNREECS